MVPGLLPLPKMVCDIVSPESLQVIPMYPGLASRHFCLWSFDIFQLQQPAMLRFLKIMPTCRAGLSSRKLSVQIPYLCVPVWDDSETLSMIEPQLLTVIMPENGKPSVHLFPFSVSFPPLPLGVLSITSQVNALSLYCFRVCFYRN